MKGGPNVAILIAAHDRPEHLLRLLSALQHPSVQIFLHIDAKSRMAPPGRQGVPNFSLCTPRVPVHWGGFSQVEATLALMRQANAVGEFTHFVFISGSDFPLRPISEIVNYLALNRDALFIHADPMPQPHKPISRLEYFHPQPSDYAIARAWHRFARRTLKPLARRDYVTALGGREPYGGTCWWAMPGEAITYIMQSLDDEPELLEFFRNTHCPDEMIFQTLVMNSPFAANQSDTLSWTDWSEGGAHPATVNTDHLPILKDIGARQEFLFARKFPDASESLVADLTADWPRLSKP